MKLFDLKELETKIGKNGFWATKSIANGCDYMAGIEELDKIMAEKNFSVMPNVAFVKNPNGLLISIIYKGAGYWSGLHNDEIKSITLERGQTFDTQSKSVVGRALVGGLLLGPLGAIIGGASGVGNKVLKDRDTLIILIEIDGKEQAILFQINKGKTEGVVKLFRQNFNQKFTIQ